MSDDVRARAEALLAALSDTRYHGIEIGTLGEPMRALRAALAVAPATAQPGAWAWLIVRKDGISTGTVGIERGKMESHAAAWNRDEVAGFPFRVVPLYAAPPATGDAAAVRPEVVCLCGSTRFIDTFAEQYGRLTDEGKIVLTVGRVVPQSEQALGSPRKAALDVLHLRKIDLADRVLVLNVGGYVGPSTRREIAYAKERGKPIDLLYPDAGLDGAAPALPLPAAPAHDAVRDATERVVNAWRWMDAPGSDAELRRAVDALYEAWTDAAARGRLLDAHREGCEWKARATKAEADRDRARALLKEARPHVQHSIDEGAETGIELLASIDAETRGAG